MFSKTIIYLYNLTSTYMFHPIRVFLGYDCILLQRKVIESKNSSMSISVAIFCTKGETASNFQANISQNTLHMCSYFLLEEVHFIFSLVGVK